MRRWLIMALTATFGSSWALPVPTTLNDFFLPGSQPNESGNIERITRCSNCHGDYGQPSVEPYGNWQGSMMAQSMRDPFFLACLTVANQDAPQSGDLCIRCHSPSGWLEGRSVPTDGSALTTDDRQGVHCDVCHRTVKPSPIGVNPYPNDPTYTANTYPLDQTYLNSIATIPPTSADGMYVVDSDQGKRGPYSETVARHTYYYSPFHRDANMCGTCHDVSNPAFTRQPDGNYAPNAFDQAAPGFSPYDLFPIERTFSEWTMSDYNSATGVYAPQFGGNRDTVRTCQDCHLRDVTGNGCDKPDAPLRTDLPKHDMTGGNTVVPHWVAQQYPSEVSIAALDSGIARARYMLRHAATLEFYLTYEGADLIGHIRVTNETGHKLPSGYPEGRRMWLNVRAYDSDSLLIYESAAYDTATAELDHDTDAKIYEIKPGISHTLAPIVDLPAGPSFHFVVNDTVYKDNRIPPRGFANSNFEMIQSPPVGYAYSDRQYWDNTEYNLPPQTAYADITLYYQTTSKDYIEFLRDANVTNGAGQTAYDLWAANGKSAPEIIATEHAAAPPPPLQPVADLVIQSEDELVHLTWSAALGATSYKIYRFYQVNSSPDSWELIAQQADTAFSEAVLSDSTSVFYVVKSANE